MNNMSNLLSKLPRFVLPVLGFFIILSIGISGAKPLMDDHFMSFDSESKKMVGKQLSGEISEFFIKMEQAINAEDVDVLMALYASNYTRGPYHKKMMRQTWSGIFSRNEDVNTVHDMSFINFSPDTMVVVVRCSGLLMGVPKGMTDPVAIDNWKNSFHVIAKAGGQWKLVTTTVEGGNRPGLSKEATPII